MRRLLTSIVCTLIPIIAHASDQRGRELAREFCTPYVTVEMQLFIDKDAGMSKKQAYVQVETEVPAAQQLSNGAIYLEVYRVYHFSSPIPAYQLASSDADSVILRRAFMSSCEAQNPFDITAHNH